MTSTLPVWIDDPINAAILAVSEDRLAGFQLDPFGAVAQAAAIDVETVVERVVAMVRAGTIRRVRQTLMATNLAQGALVAWQVPAERLNDAFEYLFGADPFSGHVVIRTTDAATPGSNYRLWTTLKVPQGFAMQKHADFLAAHIGAEHYRMMPAKRLFALGVGHVRRRGMEPGSRADVLAEVLDTNIVELDALEWRVLTALKREFEPAELVRDLWRPRAAEAGVSLEEFERVGRDLNARRVIGRFSTFLEHVKPSKDTGERVTRYNALFHWAVTPGREIEAGREVGRHHIMTHAYWREGGPEFRNVNIMGVAHGTDKDVVLAHKAAIDEHLRERGIEIGYTNVFWGGRSEIKPSEISPVAYVEYCRTNGIDPEVDALKARRLFAGLGLLLGLTFALGACTKISDSGPTAATGGGSTHPNRLVIATAADPKNLNPAFASADPVLELSAFLFSYTVRYDNNARPIPDAVSEIPTRSNGDVSADGLTLKYKLRHGIKWHDGVELTCRDMRFTWQVMVNPKNNVNTTEGWTAIRAVDCTDPYVAVVYLKHVYAPFLQQLWSVNGNGPIMPEHLLAKLNDAQGSLNNAAYNSAPVGSGPYKFVSWTRGSEVRFAANPDYFLGRPKIAEIVYKIIPDQNTLTTQLQTHEIDVGWNLISDSLATVQRIPGATIRTPVVYIFDHVDFNLKRPLFSDVRVRRALTYAIDRRTLLKKLRHNLGELSDSFLDPTLYPFAQTSRLMRYPYDVAEAKRLLEQAGWHVGADGVRVKNGQRLAFQLSTQVESIAGRAEQEQIQTYWHTIGAAVEVKNFPTPSFFDNTSAGVIQGGKYDVAIFAWVGASDIDNSALYSNHNFSPHGQNSLFWNNPIATAAMDDANATIDQRKRIADYATVQYEFTKDDPSIILWFRKDLEVYPTALKNFTSTPVITTPFWNTWAYTL